MSKFLLDLAEAHGFTMRKQGRSFGSNKCPSCREGSAHSNRLCIFEGKDGKWRWKCQACGDGGDSADFLVSVSGISLRDALKQISEDLPASVSQGISTQLSSRTKEQNEHLLVALERLYAVGHLSVPEVVEALKARDLSESTIADAARRGMVRMLPAKPLNAFRFLLEHLGEGLLRASGLWKDGSKWPAIVFRPLIFFLPSMSAAEFRILGQPKGSEPKGLRYGSLTYPWWWVGDDTKPTGYRKGIIVEGGIDVLSLVELGLPQDQVIIGLPGTSSWRAEWFVKIAERNPGIQYVDALDNDEAGNKASAKIKECLQNLGLPWERKTPGNCKDWNELLHQLRA